MNRGFAVIAEQPKKIHIYSRKQRILAIKVIIYYLERIRDAERRHSNISGRQYEAELIASIIDEAVCILEAIQ